MWHQTLTELESRRFTGDRKAELSIGGGDDGDCPVAAAANDVVGSDGRLEPRRRGTSWLRSHPGALIRKFTADAGYSIAAANGTWILELWRRAAAKSRKTSG